MFEKYAEGDVRSLRETPLDEVLLRMVIQFLPNPLQAAPYRMPFLAPGVDKDSELYQSLITSNPNGPLMGMFTKVFVSQKDFRPVLIGRVFSGTLHQGDMIRLVNRKRNTANHSFRRYGNARHFRYGLHSCGQFICSLGFYMHIRRNFR